mmetsp:Transcript_96/g.143  ORF Transcript_96/g.143 Transcript_96/m.143 type:complete len:252 (+) Transcript_96:247-1002(+)
MMAEEQIWSSVRGVSEWEEMNPACRKTMEDAHVAIDNFAGRPGQGLFAVFDGHGGRGIVDYLSKNFCNVLETELGYDGGNRSINECLTSAYLITDIQTSQEGLMSSGSTAASCLIRTEECGDANELRRVCYCANVGDTRAVLCRRGGTAQRLTFDHKASDPSEIKRIEEAGGFILRKRVLGILSVSRSFGDHAMKKFVVARPFTTTTMLTDTDRFLIVGKLLFSFFSVCFDVFNFGTLILSSLRWDMGCFH